jgi:hypothetical protein
MESAFGIWILSKTIMFLRFMRWHAYIKFVSFLLLNITPRSYIFINREGRCLQSIETISFFKDAKKGG